MPPVPSSEPITIAPMDVGNNSPTEISAPKKSGRPMKIFVNCSKRTKNRKVSKLMEQYSLEELELAVQKMKGGKHKEEEKRLSPSDALALYLNLDISERKYNILRKAVNVLHPHCFPSLYSLRNQKQKLVPTVTATETSAEVDLKSIMRLTTERVLDLCKVQDKMCKLQLIGKWGMDGSSGHSRYKQKFSNADQTDEFMFFIAFVPIK